MDALSKLPYDLVSIAQAFNIKQNQDCTHLAAWLDASYELNEIEHSILDNTFERIYGGYLIGTNWWFATLIDNKYCLSRQYSLSQRHDFDQVAFILRKLKELILNR